MHFDQKPLRDFARKIPDAMRFSSGAVDALEDTRTAVIPLYPIEAWNEHGSKTSKNKNSLAATFREIKLELLSNPTDSSSQKMGNYFKVFESGTPEQWCRWRDDLKRAWKGLNNNTGTTRLATTKHLLEGQALDDLTAYFQQDGVNETTANVEKALKKVAVTIFPSDAVTRMKQYLNFELKKPNKL